MKEARINEDRLTAKARAAEPRQVAQPHDAKSLSAADNRTGSDYPAFLAWMRTPIVTVLMILLPIALFHHAALALQVVIDDYVHSSARFPAVLVVRMGCYGLAAAGVLASLKLALGRGRHRDEGK